MKTKLGISVAMLAAVAYLTALFSNHIAMFVVVGYILLCETDEWLKKSAVKAVAVCFGFAVMSALIGLIPGVINVIDDFVYIFGGSFSISVINRLIVFLNSALNLAETVVLLALAVLALSGKTLKIPVVDNFLEKYM